MTTRPYRIITGIAVSNGSAVSRLVRLDSQECVLPSTHKTHSPDQEWSNFLNAQARAIEHLEQIAASAPASARISALPTMLEGFELLMTDEILIQKIKNLVFSENMNATSAVNAAFADAAALISSFDEEHLKDKSLDLKACEEFLLNELSEQPSGNDLSELKNCIVIVHEPKPHDVIRFHEAGVAGVIAEQGTQLCHAAILARSFNIPALFGVGRVTDELKAGQMAILDCAEQTLVINPSRSDIRKAEARRAVDLMVKQKLRAKSGSCALTLDGQRIHVFANVEGSCDTSSLKSYGAEGVGLLRTEFLHLNSTSIPTTEQATVFFRMTAAALAPKWMTVRLLDAGGDKPYPTSDVFSSGTFGLRGIRYLLAEKNILESQLEALIRANIHGNIRVLIPFVTDVDEVRQVRLLMQEIWNRIPVSERPLMKFPQVGAMIETPAACNIVDHLGNICEFLSVGTNDLTQHILCVDRNDPELRKMFNAFHPAVLRSLKTIFAIQNKMGLDVSVCGELASDPIATELLIGLGCRHLSVPTSSIPLIKELIRKLDFEVAENFAQSILRIPGGAEIQALLKRRYEKNFDYAVSA